MMETSTKTEEAFIPNVNEEGKKIAIISYITIVGLIIAFVMNNEKKQTFASYHIKKSLGLAITSMALWIVGVIPILGWIISILGTFVIIYMWVMGLMNAINEKEKPVPILGEKYNQWFGNIQ